MDTHGWFVCPTISMVTTSHATGLEKTLFRRLPLIESVKSRETVAKIWCYRMLPPKVVIK